MARKKKTWWQDDPLVFVALLAGASLIAGTVVAVLTHKLDMIELQAQQELVRPPPVQ